MYMLLLILGLTVTLAAPAEFHVARMSDGTDKVIVVPSVSSVGPRENLARIVFNQTFLELGWDFLQIEPSRAFFANATNTEAFRSGYYFGGFGEGFVTAEKYAVFFQSHNYSVAGKVAAWISDHIAYMREQSAANPDTPFWQQVGYLFRQMEGFVDGFNAAGVTYYKITFGDVFRLNFRYEIGDIYTATGEQQRGKAHLPLQRRLMSHCSALVKVTYDDLFFSHDTWGGFDNMVRQYKTYIFQTTVSLSGFAGQIHSGDDWYITSNKLASQETTNEYYNNTLAKLYIHPNSVSEFLRVMIANYLSNDGQSWVEYFATNHSGTYCNQYMVVDYKLYTPGQQGSALKDNLLWVVEEMPGKCMSQDVTSVLRSTSYWASYNLPYFNDVYVESGFQEMETDYGTFFSYTKYARPEIFRRQHSTVKDLPTMRTMMQYNQYQTDPFSIIPNCTACNPAWSPQLSIACRADQVSDAAVLPTPPEYRQFFTRSAFGAYDSKIASYAMIMQNLTSSVFCGPTPQQPLFRWSTSGLGKAPPGAPDLYNFSWVSFSLV